MDILIVIKEQMNIIIDKMELLQLTIYTRIDNDSKTRTKPFVGYNIACQATEML